MERTDIRPADIAVSRVHGTADLYLVGRVISGTAGSLALDGLVITHVSGRQNAIETGYNRRSGAQKVWLFEAPDDKGYMEAPQPHRAKPPG
jgi:hypothetical protein